MVVQYTVCSRPRSVAVTKTVQGLRRRTEALRWFRDGLASAKTKAQLWIEADFAKMQQFAELTGHGEVTCEIVCKKSEDFR